MTTFDTLKYAEALEVGGIPKDQAKAQAKALAEALKESAGELATRQDLKDLKADLTAEIGEVRQTVAVVRAEIGMMKWMLGGVVFGILLLLVRAFWPAGITG
ncbi:MAG: DUF1640 domain-containing protein [Pseudomonadota bacterium]|nr:DUF1640 domain-containing protein [Pseudomonadota bacterium]